MLDVFQALSLEPTQILPTCFDGYPLLKLKPAYTSVMIPTQMTGVHCYQIALH